jgi:hypothetical protein
MPQLNRSSPINLDQLLGVVSCQPTVTPLWYIAALLPLQNPVPFAAGTVENELRLDTGAKSARIEVQYQRCPSLIPFAAVGFG